MKRFTVPAAAMLAACTPTLPDVGPGSPPVQVARIGQTLHVDGPTVTPLAVIEDSRCPRGVRCVWAGRVRISARVLTGPGAKTITLTLGQPVLVADGMLELVNVTPERGERPIAPVDYRFGFHFMGGL